MLQTRIKKLLLNPLFISLSLFLLIIVSIRPFGNFSINDDWAFFFQVEAISKGIFIKSAVVDASFILQGFIGYFWTLIFGLNFVALRILTIIFSTLTIFGFYKILTLFTNRPLLITTALITLSFNPIFFMSSLSFMTEMYFLFFTVFSFYFFLKYISTDTIRFLFLASLLGGLSVMVRQYGLVLFVVYVTVIFYQRKIGIVGFCNNFLLPFGFFSAIGLFWPQHKSAVYPHSENILKLLTHTSMFARINELYYVFPYIGFFIFPFLINFLLSKSRKVIISVLILSVVIAKSFYSIDLLNLGNTFYLEGLYSKSKFYFPETILNNIPFKLFLSYLMAVGAISIILVFAEKLYKGVNLREKIAPNHLTFILTTLGFLGIAFISDEFYDRYLINFFIFLTIYIVYLTKELEFTKASALTTIILIFTVYCLVQDYYTQQNIKWSQASEISLRKNLVTGVFVNGTYLRYVSLNRTKDYLGNLNTVPPGVLYKCFVEDYYKDRNTIISQIVNKFSGSKKMEKYLGFPTINGKAKERKIPDIEKNIEKLTSSVKYFSPLYNLVGKDAYVGSFCLKD